MFEKEAEEYFETECLHRHADTEEQLKEDVVPAFQKGAEFGYNKAKEELEKDNNRLFLEGAKRVAELEAQIEKMKCCGNCAKRGHICVAEEMQGNLCGKNKVKLRR